MSTLLIAILSFVGFLVAYHTYGRWLARKIFQLDPEADMPSRRLRDDVDYVPSKKEVVFGHHFTSIAGTGPIVGPAIAVFWGWLPALLWVVFGSIFIGAVHDFGALVVSLRNRGQTVGEIAGRMINRRTRTLFLFVLLFCLLIVIAIFGLVIAIIFSMYPESVLSVWIEIPLAIAIGFWVYRRGGGLLAGSLIALATMYVMMYVGAYWLPFDIRPVFGIAVEGGTLIHAIQIWTVILLVYCFFASVLPVWTLLQPRDFINSHELVLALLLLFAGLAVAAMFGGAELFTSAPALTAEVPADAPPILPFLFITIACGAISGFHCLVSSGTSSKQLAKETDAQYVGYGAMLLEGMLAVVVILACCAGVAMGKFDRVLTNEVASGFIYAPHVEPNTGEQLTGMAAWTARYNPGTSWASFNLGKKVGAFIEGGGNFLTTLGIPLKMGIAIVAVLVASFAATTLDTATRLQRYVIQELAGSANVKPLTNKYAATAVALFTGGVVAMLPGALGPGSGGLILWPLFGATNQLLAGLAFLVVAFYLWRRGKPVWFAVIPMIVMLVLPGWAMIELTFTDFMVNEAYPLWQKIVLTIFGLMITALQLWIMIEALLMWPRAKGMLEDALPPLGAEPAMRPTVEGGRSC